MRNPKQLIKLFTLLIMFSSIFMISLAFAQTKSDIIYDILAKMKNKLQLSSEQVQAIKPIMREDYEERERIMEEVENLQISRRTARGFLEDLRKRTNEQLVKHLSSDQMKKWIDYQNLLQGFNGKTNFDKGGYSSFGIGGMGVNNSF